jgi:hypothetical protein
MNRTIALILVIWGTGTALVGVMDLLARDARPGYLFASFVLGPLLVALGFWVDRRGKAAPPHSPKPTPRTAPTQWGKTVPIVGVILAVAVAVTLLVLASFKSG